MLRCLQQRSAANWFTVNRGDVPIHALAGKRLGADAVPACTLAGIATPAENLWVRARRPKCRITSVLSLKYVYKIVRC